MAEYNWNKILNSFPEAHLLQSAQWAEVKGQYGWQPFFLVWHRGGGDLELTVRTDGDIKIKNPAAAALVLERKAFRGISVMYVPKGPILRDWSDKNLRQRVITDLQEFAKRAGAIQIKIDPDLVVGKGVPGEENEETDQQGIEITHELKRGGWRFSPDQIQFRNTFLIDLRPEEDDILSRMKSKTRYNIRLASRKGITIRYGDLSELGNLYKMYAETSLRGGFTIRGEEYYQNLWQEFLRYARIILAHFY